jgi:hypothetical protein
MAHQVVEDEDMHGMPHHLDPHGQLMGSGMPRHATPAYVPGHLMMEYDMGAHQSAPTYAVPHVLPGHPAPVMMMPMNAPTPQMPMQIQQERAPPKKRGRAAANMKDDIESSVGSSKKRAAPKRKKAEATRSAVAKRASMVNPVVMQAPDMGGPMVGYMQNMGMQGLVMGKPDGDEDPSSPLLPPSTVIPPMARPRATDDTRAAQRSANALREYQRRARETPPERAARRAANAARARQRRAEETPEERQRRLHREALRQQRRRDNETERERAARRAANALRQQERRAREAMARQQQVQMREQMNNQQQQVQMPLSQGHESHEDVAHHPPGHYIESVGDPTE